jgi:hypothetical protein
VATDQQSWECAGASGDMAWWAGLAGYPMTCTYPVLAIAQVQVVESR